MAFPKHEKFLLSGFSHLVDHPSGICNIGPIVSAGNVTQVCFLVL